MRAIKFSEVFFPFLVGLILSYYGGQPVNHSMSNDINKLS